MFKSPHLRNTKNTERSVKYPEVWTHKGLFSIYFYKTSLRSIVIWSVMWSEVCSSSFREPSTPFANSTVNWQLKHINKAALSVLYAVHVRYRGQAGMQRWPGWSSVSQRSLTSLVSHGVFVEEVLSHATLRGSHAPQVGYPVTELFDGFNLLIQKMCFYEVTHLWIKRTECYSY